MLDALVGDVLEAHGGAEGKAREDGHLGGGVAAGDVVGGVGLGITLKLSLSQSLGVVGAAGHLGEDEVGGAVDDPVNALDMGAGKRLGEHAHDRNDAGDGGLEAQLHAVLGGGREQLLAVLGEQLLVGGDDVAPGAHRLQYVVARRLDAPQQARPQARNPPGSPRSGPRSA